MKEEDRVEREGGSVKGEKGREEGKRGRKGGGVEGMKV